MRHIHATVYDGPTVAGHPSIGTYVELPEEWPYLPEMEAMTREIDAEIAELREKQERAKGDRRENL